MAASFEINGNNVKITFEFNPLIENGQNVIDLASFFIFRNPRYSWDDLSNQDKLNLIDKEIKLYVLRLAKEGRIRRGKAIAETTYPIDL